MDPTHSATEIACGPLSMTFEDGDLFDVCWDGVEVVQRIYLAVRDEAWNTIPAAITNVRSASDAETASIDFDAEHDEAGIRFIWTGSIRADWSGTVSFEFRGEAHTDFRYSKIGFNVHHGLRTHSGRSFHCHTENGAYSGTFAPDIDPQLIRDGTLTAMTPHFDRLEIDLEGVSVDMSFTGDRFEMQDHRNWLDANWKTYGTPLSYGFPMDAAVGDVLHQRIDISMQGTPGVARPEIVEISTGGGDGGRLPRIGHRLVRPPSEIELDHLAKLRPDHVRVDLHPGDQLRASLGEGVRVAEHLGAGLELAVYLRPDELHGDAAAAARAVSGISAPVERVLVLAEESGFSVFRGACPPEAIEAFRSALEAMAMSVPALASGTNQFFADINRDRPEYHGDTGLVFAANPQVHACDRRSMMQNFQSVPEVVCFARRLYGDIDVVLSPCDLIGANGPYPGGTTTETGQPPNEDPRQASAFCAAWVVGALSEISRGLATSVTLFELVGPRGVVDGEPHPVAHVLERLVGLATRPLAAVGVSDPGRIASLAFGDADSPELVVANLTDGPIDVLLPWGDSLQLGAFDVVAATRERAEHVA